MATKLNRFLTGDATVRALKLNKLFSNLFVFKKLKLIQGDGSHPRPHLWFKTFLFLVVIGGITLINYILLGAIAFPWLTFVFASIIPVTVAVFLYELVNKESVKIGEMFLVVVGGVTLSFLITGLISLPFASVYETLSIVVIAPIVEEIAKLVSVFIILIILKVKTISKALLYAWLIGSGFTIAETGGYSSYYGIIGLYSEIIIEGNIFTPNGAIDLSTMFRRIYLTFTGHSLWAMFYGAALYFMKNNDKSKPRITFLLIWTLLAILLHAANNVSAVLEIPLLSTLILIVLLVFSILIFFYLIDAVIRIEYREIESETPVNNESADFTIENDDTNNIQQ